MARDAAQAPSPADAADHQDADPVAAIDARTLDGPLPTGDAAPPANTTPPITASKQSGVLRAAGLDPLRLPSLDVANQQAHVPLMHSFVDALGSACEGCHAPNAAVWTRDKRIASHMWNDILGKLVFKDGRPLYCDSCHQGKVKFLDRKDRAAVMIWMQRNFVDPLARRDGAPHDCSTCHGSPFNDHLLDRWAQP